MSLVSMIHHFTWTLCLCTQIRLAHLIQQTICSLRILRLRDRLSFQKIALMLSQREKSRDASSVNTASTTWRPHSSSLLINLMHSRFQAILEAKKQMTQTLPLVRKFSTIILELSPKNILRHCNFLTSHSQVVSSQPPVALMLSPTPTSSSPWRPLEIRNTSQCHKKTCSLKPFSNSSQEIKRKQSDSLMIAMDLYAILSAESKWI